MRAKPRHTGFTLFELVLVIAIVAVLAAVAMPRYSRSISRYRAALAARRIVADLAYARSRARSTSQSVTVAFDESNNRITMVGVPSLDHPGQDHVTDFDEDPYRVTMTNADFAATQVVVFDGHGRPSSGGSVDVQAGEASVTVSLDAGTGRAAAP